MVQVVHSPLSPTPIRVFGWLKSGTLLVHRWYMYHFRRFMYRFYGFMYRFRRYKVVSEWYMSGTCTGTCTGGLVLE
nr:MAG TPA: hypothetical protein [Caudoviricetes sp.]